MLLLGIGLVGLAGYSKKNFTRNRLNQKFGHQGRVNFALPFLFGISPAYRIKMEFFKLCDTDSQPPSCSRLPNLQIFKHYPATT
jgi:hypothetical protein